jgi:acyl-coenzyme A thioesterase PaaI-like protein
MTQPADSRFRLDRGVGPISIESDGAVFDPVVDSFINDLSFDFELSEDATRGHGHATITSATRSSEALVRPSVLLTIADIVGGVPAMYASAPKLALTLDMSIHLNGNQVESELEVTSNVVKIGSRTVVSEVRFINLQSRHLTALSHLTFMTSPRPNDLACPIHTKFESHGTLQKSLGECLGLRTMRPGVTELDRRPYVVQPAGHLQGGVVAFLAESAAESMTGFPVVDLEIKFLSGIRVGPGRATAERFGDELVRIEVRDIGDENRLAALGIGRVSVPH